MQRPIEQCGIKQPDETGIEPSGLRRRVKSTALLSVLLLAVCMAPTLAQELVGKNLKMFYQQNCARCHGPDGSGVSAEGKKLSGQNLIDPDWQRNTQDDKMMKAIMKGKFFGLAMPGFKGTLTGNEAQRMVTDIIRKSKKGQVIAPGAERSDE